MFGEFSAIYIGIYAAIKVSYVVVWKIKNRFFETPEPASNIYVPGSYDIELQ